MLPPMVFTHCKAQGKHYCELKHMKIVRYRRGMVLRAPFHWVVLYNTNGFGTKIMYDYITMKSMFLVAKLFSHPFIVYASLTILLLWTKHKQPQNYSKPKAFQNQNCNSNKLCIHTITLYKWKCFSRPQTTTYIPTKRKLVKKFPKVYPPHGSPTDSTINQKET
jgi:hypothetical protein